MTRALTEEQRQELLRQTPAGRPAHPDEAADAVAFLAGAGVPGRCRRSWPVPAFLAGAGVPGRCR